MLLAIPVKDGVGSSLSLILLLLTWNISVFYEIPYSGLFISFHHRILSIHVLWFLVDVRRMKKAFRVIAALENGKYGGQIIS